jgi:hypothetical protein
MPRRAALSPSRRGQSGRRTGGTANRVRGIQRAWAGIATAASQKTTNRGSETWIGTTSREVARAGTSWKRPRSRGRSRGQATPAGMTSCATRAGSPNQDEIEIENGNGNGNGNETGTSGSISTAQPAASATVTGATTIGAEARAVAMTTGMAGAIRRPGRAATHRDQHHTRGRPSPRPRRRYGEQLAWHPLDADSTLAARGLS